MEQLFFAGKAYLKINSLVKTPLHEFMTVELYGLYIYGLLTKPISDIRSNNTRRKRLFYNSFKIRNNLSLLEKYNIEYAKASVIK